MDLQERRILTVTSLGHFLSHVNMLVFPAVVLPLAGRLHLELAAVLSLSFWHYLLFGLTALPWGLAADRWGARYFLLLFFFGAGFCSLAAALLIDRPAWFSLALAGIGFFSGIYHPTGLGLISKGVKRLSLGMGINGMFGNLGLAAAPALAGIANQVWGPQGAYFGLALVNLAGGVHMLSAKFDEPEKVSGGQTDPGPSSITPFLILLVAMMLGGITYQGATVILPAYFEIKTAGLHQTLAGLFSQDLSANLSATLLASMIYLLGILGQFLGGRVGERFEVRWSYLAFHLLTLPALFLMATAADALLVLLALFYFFFLLGMQPLENTLVARLTPPRFHHAAYGAKFVLTFGVGSVAVKMVAAIEKFRGLESVFPTLGIITILLVAAIVVLLTRTAPVGGWTRPARAAIRQGAGHVL
ncbi:MAG: MFS transporter [Thermodesulfobacteriota bacterium]